ncbi:hypothetical protein A2V56_00755 [Candidatus Woesebacteria bacterium RBG_19FT_COMBO_42_9]|uniref:Methyltransferase type 11 domain-containing protein n=1 Tax=Candidatus Woesebacteria bacterium RBG_16_42_24 TaxID=1802485 RepID=A0A1F7XKF5_9BACT|nr:MAG: hypothetical protein A2V97_00615 [Candidatus Woesebacteria bacterium RBG_16_42_24]OGM16565.1 MAG: hypothetical protein A2V56_00755 [Candidatus Woesebacteria bacterium RBG_19FT_COMBO_42_9]OGM66181.1 MAG: hypothetical protein A2985_00700 [Candidatus Woesebacteria bacterium RIFCSPLOWO2_01_FULL_43_11]
MNLGKSLLPFQCPNCFEKGRVKLEIDGQFKVYFCHNCHNGFTSPVPEHIRDYYPEYYWISSSTLGLIKETIFNLFQRRRITWLTKSVSKGFILDVGSGEATFGTYLSQISQKFTTVSLESSSSLVKNRAVIKRDFLKWATDQKFNAVCFWESLEHTNNPQKYLQKAYSLLNNGGLIFIEFPRYQCFESRLFGQNWFHLDLPRHLAHLTDNGVRELLIRSGFTKIRVRGVLAFEYAPWGFIASFLKTINPKAKLTDNLKASGNILFLILLAPFFLLACIIEAIFLFLDEAPIALVTAEKK